MARYRSSYLGEDGGGGGGDMGWLLWGALIVGGGYLLYKAAAGGGLGIDLSSIGIGQPRVTPPGQTPTSVQVQNIPTVVNKGAVYNSLLAASGSDNRFSGAMSGARVGTPPLWNVYLGQVLGGVSPLPNMLTVFGNIDLNAPMTLSEFWSRAQNYL